MVPQQRLDLAVHAFRETIVDLAGGRAHLDDIPGLLRVDHAEITAQVGVMAPRAVKRDRVDLAVDIRTP